VPSGISGLSGKTPLQKNFQASADSGMGTQSVLCAFSRKAWNKMKNSIPISVSQKKYLQAL